VGPTDLIGKLHLPVQVGIRRRDQRIPGIGVPKRLKAMRVSLAPKARAPARPSVAARAGVPGLPTRAAARHIMAEMTAT
jgi:hypothetical protein